MIFARAFLILFLIGTFGPQLGPQSRAHAKAPFLSSEENSRFEATYEKFTRLKPSQIERYLSRENSKGEMDSGLDADRTNEPDLWSTLDSATDYVEGTSTEKMYLKHPIALDSTKDVIVAVIDGGVDIQHEDLQGKIWTNPTERGHDEDQDGYLNDIHGWNFLHTVTVTNLEVTREYARLEKISAVRPLTLEETQLFARVQTDYDARVKDSKDQITLYQMYKPALEILLKAGLTDESIEALDQINSSDPIVAKAKQIIRPFLRRFEDSASVAEMIQKQKDLLNVSYNKDLNSSLQIGDHADQLDEVGYGDDDVTGKDSSHGTHVAGIIGANRLNHLGILGQAQNVKIMSLRAVPSDGDERDKDVGNAIRYAADHGAKVINMSFGKEFSPFQDYVRASAAYAASKGVVMVHSAGNEGVSLEDGIGSYPNKKTLDPSTLDYWIEVGASDRSNFDQRLAARFSNFGKFMVDLFAPGVSIVSTIPHNEYGVKSGTSMAAPEVSGVAALLLSQFPEADGKMVRRAILDSVNLYDGAKVIQPSKAPNQVELVFFESLSASGGTLNAYQAMNRLYQMTHPK